MTLPGKPAQTPPVPTMTNQSVIPGLESQEPYNQHGWTPAAELGENIVARPMSTPDGFVNMPSEKYLVNPTLTARGIFTDKRRFAQAKAQGWRLATKADIKPGALISFAAFEEEGGTKYLNGDLVLMVIKRDVYLGALKYKHQVAAALSDAAVQRRVSGARAAHDMGETVASVNRARVAKGSEPVMTVFTPGAADLNDTVLAGAVAGKELGRMGNAPRDMGSVADLTKENKT